MHIGGVVDAKPRLLPRLLNVKSLEIDKQHFFDS